MRTPNAALRCLAPCLVLVALPSFAAEPVDYAIDIKPIFERHCVSCHGAVRSQGGLRLDASQFLRTTGDSGGSVVPGDSASSVLLAALKGEGGYTRMPQDADPLPDAQIALIERWIAEGAVAPESEKADADPAEHWAFRPVARPTVPFSDESAGVIDAFVMERHDAAGVVPLAEAPRHTLLRRLYLDLIGLPPSPAELEAFLNDAAPDAYDRVVDRLLADPRHGERWGRHWMDVWRYSDWYGYGNELRNSQKHIWHWRDWIIESLNENQPYDRMVVEMLAADEVAPLDDDALRATGFLARNYYKFNRDVWLDRTVEHTGKAFLGLTFNCARCHDHLFDPISQRDHYAMRAFFEPHQVRLDPVDGDLDENKNGLPRVYDADLSTPTYLFVRGNDKQPDKDHPLAPELPKFFVPKTPTVESVALPPAAHYAGLRLEVREVLRRQADAEVAAADEAVRKMLLDGAVGSLAPGVLSASLAADRSVAEARLRAARLRRAALEMRISADDAKYANPPAAEADSLAVAAAKTERTAALAAADAEALAARKAQDEAQRKPAAEREKAIADAQKALDAAMKAIEAAKAELGKTDGNYSPLTTVYPSTSSGRRTRLANWIVDPANPLTARVAVNHVWTRHFGKPLVESMFDFGMHGSAPTDPELLDWLAAEFVASGWNFKHLHRLIVTSDTYRLNSTVAADHPSLAIDPDNRLLWHMNARRGEGEVIRDSMLAVAGRLDERMGGPELDAAADQTTARRSVYYRHAPEKYAPFLQAFDGASADECYLRAETVVPTQALAQVNSRITREESRSIAADLFGTGEATAADLIERAFKRVLCRAAASEERAACIAFLEDQEIRLANPSALTTLETGPDTSIEAAHSPRLRAFASLVHVLLNHHDFVTIR
ncbi:MAG: DUF1553 domain-containing protein [Planctomycetota bacterium]|nr:DUF1553 domain-containing protein [Planctomycetaceae bacterium]MDQ3329114.1 DUF1553 domain-containing protein [Planctomycetota bacterium]